MMMEGREGGGGRMKREVLLRWRKRGIEIRESEVEFKGERAWGMDCPQKGENGFSLGVEKEGGASHSQSQLYGCHGD
jgi:hypothetical protein